MKQGSQGVDFIEKVTCEQRLDEVAGVSQVSTEKIIPGRVKKLE